jgi:hypothetical protein
MFNEEGIGNKIITAGIIGMIAWVLVNTNDMSRSIAVLDTKMASLEAVVSIAAQDRYTAKQAETDNKHLQNQIDRLETWTQNLSTRLRELEDYVRSNRLDNKPSK